MMTRALLGAAVLAVLSTPVTVQAEAAGVATLLSQATYWQGKGRQDLANQAYRRVLAIDPANAAAKRGLAGPAAPVAAPRPAPPKPAPVAARPVVAAPKPPVVAKAAPVAPRPQPTADTAGDSRAAGFKALNGNDLDGALRNFRKALTLRPNDADALGGMGIVKLRQKRFAEARDFLTRASSRGPAAKWSEALSSARFYAGLDEARAAQSSGRIDEAQKIAEDLSNSDSPQRGPALELLASIYETKGHYAEAAALYQDRGQARWHRSSGGCRQRAPGDAGSGDGGRGGAQRQRGGAPVPARAGREPDRSMDSLRLCALPRPARPAW